MYMDRAYTLFFEIAGDSSDVSSAIKLFLQAVKKRHRAPILHFRMWEVQGYYHNAYLNLNFRRWIIYLHSHILLVLSQKYAVLYRLALQLSL